MAHPLKYGNSVFLHVFDFLRIVRHQPNACDTELLQHFRRHPVIPFVRRKAESGIGVDSVIA